VCAEHQPQQRPNIKPRQICFTRPVKAKLLWLVFDTAALHRASSIHT
jgi:hypothetical protein